MFSYVIIKNIQYFDLHLVSILCKFAYRKNSLHAA